MELIRMFGQLLLLLSVCHRGWTLGYQHWTRTLTTVLNPNCPDDLCTIANGPAHDDQPAIITVVHVRADGPNDTIHHIWDFTGRPSVLIARTALNATLAIDWPAFMRNESRSVRFEPAPLYSSCLVLTRLLAYNDATDVGHLLDNATEATDQQPPIDAFDTRDFRWLRQHFENADELAHVDVVGTNAGSFGANGAVRLTMKAFGRRQYDLASPHLLHSENGTQVAMMLDQLNVTDAKTDGARRRFALEWFHVASEPPGAGEFSVQHRRVLDDEHTPGVFELRDIVSPGSMLYANGSYVHFRPVSYTSVVREMGASTAVHVQRPQNISDAEQRLADGGSMAWSFYGYALGGKELLVQAYNVSFGAAGDGFYARNNLNTWTFEVGYGEPPEEHMSLFVMIVASVGLVLPLVLLLSGGLYICGKRLRERQRQRREEYY